MENNEFVHVVDTVVKDPDSFLQSLIMFLNLPSIRVIIGEKELMVSWDYKSERRSRAAINGVVKGLLGVVNFIVLKSDFHDFNLNERDFLEQRDLLLRGMKSSADIAREMTNVIEFGFKDAAKLYVAQIFLLRGLRVEFISLVRNFVLTGTNEL